MPHFICIIQVLKIILDIFMEEDMGVFFISSSTFFWPHFSSFNDNSYKNGIYGVPKVLFFS